MNTAHFKVSEEKNNVARCINSDASNHGIVPGDMEQLFNLKLRLAHKHKKSHKVPNRLNKKTITGLSHFGLQPLYHTREVSGLCVI